MQDGEPATSAPITLDDIDRAPEVIPPSPTDVRVSTKAYAERLAAVGTAKDDLKAQVDAETARLLNGLIGPFADRAFWFMCAYCGSVLILLLLHGFHVCGFDLPDSSLDFLVGSTAATVIGLVGMVLTGIFLGARK